MDDETCYYDENHEDPNGAAASNGGYATPMPMGLEEDLKLSSYSLEQHPNSQTAAVNFELDHQLNSQLMEDIHNNWDSKLRQNHMHDIGRYQQPQIDLQCFNPGAAAEAPPYAQTPTPDLLNLFHFQGFPNSSISSANSNKRPSYSDILGAGDADRSGSSILYDSRLHLDLPPQQTPIFKELFHSLPHNRNYAGSSSACFSGGAGLGMDDANVGGFYQDGDGRQYENSMLNFTGDISMGKAQGKGNKQHFATERQRREQFNDKYKALKTLLPNSTKGDRASIVHDAIEYLKELLRTVDELKILVDKKRYGMARCKRRKTEDEASGDMESSSMKPLTDQDQYNGTSRGTWLKRKSRETQVDVRIIEDEVTIKLIQRKKFNCLLSVSKILDEIQLDLLHVSGGNIGNSTCFLFNTKIYEDSSVHACAIANKLIEAVDKNYADSDPLLG